MEDVMLDIETLGTGRDAAIVSIGAVRFDPTASFREGDPGFDDPRSPDYVPWSFYSVIDLSKSKYPGVMDYPTVQWWMGQSEEARQAIFASDQAKKELYTVLCSFFRWCKSSSNPVKGLWSNGPTFDEIILRDAYKRYDVDFPVSYSKSRCYRTIKVLALAKGWDKDSVKREGIHHSAIDDAIYQAKAVCSMYKYLGLANEV